MKNQYKIFMLSLGCACVQASSSDDYELSERFINSQSPTPCQTPSQTPMAAQSPANTFRELPKVKAVFVAISNGAKDDFVEALVHRALQSSPSPSVSNEFVNHIMLHYRTNSPALKDLNFRAVCGTGAERAQGRKDLAKFMRYYSNEDLYNKEK